MRILDEQREKPLIELLYTQVNGEKAGTCEIPLRPEGICRIKKLENQEYSPSFVGKLPLSNKRWRAYPLKKAPHTKKSLGQYQKFSLPSFRQRYSNIPAAVREEFLRCPQWISISKKLGELKIAELCGLVRMRLGLPFVLPLMLPKLEANPSQPDEYRKYGAVLLLRDFTEEEWGRYPEEKEAFCRICSRLPKDWTEMPQRWRFP